MKKLLSFLFFVALVGISDKSGLLTTARIFVATHFPGREIQALLPASFTSSKDEAGVAYAYAKHLSDVQVQGKGRVSRILPDDNDGSRHQRFILVLASGQTLLVAHNIDLAPAIANLKTGDMVGFNGEYEWNNKGGVIHWTHHDPRGGHPAGWLMHQGTIYQ